MNGHCVPMASETSRAAHLAQIVSESTAKIKAYRQEEGLPPLSLGPDAPLDVKYPPHVEQGRRALIDASLELGDLATGPVELRLVPGWAVMTMFAVTQFIFDFDIPHHVPLTTAEGISYDALAKRVHVGPAVLCQILRAGMPYHMFHEPRPGHVAHTATTKVMASRPLIKDWTGLSNDVLLPDAAGLTEALQKEPAADDPAKTGFMFARGGGEPGMYMYLEKHPEQVRQFAGVMGAFQQDEAYAPRHLIESWPADARGGGTKLVDLGGSTGIVAFALADAFPGLEIVVQDLPGALEAAQVREGKNLSFMPHDFFNEQPVKGTDLYLFRWVLHNWPDAHVQRILRAFIPSLKPGTRVIIFDEIMPPAGSMSLSVERNQRNSDFGMLILFNSKIRDVEEWKQVINEADQRFEVKDVRYPADSRLSFLEIIWQP
ncbi:hypothetical protein PG994_003631 [Apiospora phragmitis]|uniref:O-methyltransferase C-terminal domain-containing protein n=1 Tax=Apiospora phragmitis TaxID=2905665 RepID=A0ABR1VYQ8_9PEZI